MNGQTTNLAASTIDFGPSIANSFTPVLYDACRNKGFTVAVGGAAGIDFLNIDGAAGVAFSLDWENGFSINPDIYGSFEGGINTSRISGSELHGGLETTFFGSPDSISSLGGVYSITGANVEIGRFSFDSGRVQAAGGEIRGVQFTAGYSNEFSNPNVDVYMKYGIGTSYWNLN